MNLPRLSWTLVFLACLWVALWDDVTIANVITGIIVAVVTLTLARQPRSPHRHDRATAPLRPIAAMRLLIYIIYKIVEANLVLAWEIVTPRNRIHTGVIAVPLRTDSQISMLIVANAVTLTPGTLTLEAKGTPPVLYVHVLHLHDLDQVRHDLHHLEELSVRAFGTTAAREQLANQRTGT